jgi:hypothetical protein
MTFAFEGADVVRVSSDCGVLGFTITRGKIRWRG